MAKGKISKLILMVLRMIVLIFETVLFISS